MTHGDVEVKWIDWAGKWYVIRKMKTGSNYEVVSRHRKKTPAKNKAKEIAQKNDLSLAYYSKDANDRLIYEKDYGK